MSFRLSFEACYRKSTSDLRISVDFFRNLNIPNCPFLLATVVDSQAGQWSDSVLKQRARLRRLVGIGRLAAFRDRANHSLAVDHKGNALGHVNQWIEDAVLLRHFLVFVAQNRKRNVQFVGEIFVALGRIHADPDHLGARLLEFSNISLIRLKLLPSARGESANVEGQHHALFAAEIAEPDGMAVLIIEDEVRGGLANLGRCARSPGRQHNN